MQAKSISNVKSWNGVQISHVMSHNLSFSHVIQHHPHFMSLEVQKRQSCDLCHLSSKSEACTTKQVNHTEDMFLLSAFNNLNSRNLAELSHDTITSLISQHRFSTSNHKRVHIKGKVFAGSDQLQTKLLA